ncbi:MAG: CaiB/BaiF CoA-transferase family protein [Chloroflexota bacterium]
MPELSTAPTASTAPLSGIRVLDFSQIMQGPAATQVLGDFGADVVKVERPKGGDIFRWSIDDPAGPDHPAFVSLNRNKRSLAVDLGTQEGRDIVQQLARTADVVVSNFRPGVMERLGLGYEQLSAVNPRIIWAIGLGYGSEGPYVAKGGQDMLAQAYSGAMSHLLEGWEPRVYPVSLADYSTGMHLVQGILLALLAREKTGRGQRIECSLYDSMLAMQMLEAAMVLNGRRPLNWAGLPLNGTFRTTDGAIVLVGAFKPNPLRDICAALGLEDLSLRPELRTQTDQLAHRPMLQALFRERFATDTTAHWLAKLEEQDLLCAPVRVLEDALEDEQTAVNQMLLTMDHATLGSVRVVASPLHLSETGPRLSRAAPRLGADSADVLAELGVAADEVAALRAAGVIGG